MKTSKAVTVRFTFAVLLLLATVASAFGVGANSPMNFSTQSQSSLPTTNQTLRADAGEDQTVAVNTLVSLDGSATTNPVGGKLLYSWRLAVMPIGSQVMIVNDDPVSAQAVLTPDLPGDYVITLIVYDDKGNRSIDSMVVTVNPLQNVRPVASISGESFVTEGDTVTLDGTGSSDANGDDLTFMWRLLAHPPGSTVMFDDPMAGRVDFVADKAGIYRVQLVVNDGQADSDAQRLDIIVNVAPVTDLRVEIDSPQSLSTVGQPVVTVTGSVSPASATLTINDVVVPFEAGLFSVPFELVQGKNTIVARVSFNGAKLTDAIKVVLDLTPPNITVESHENSQTVYTDKITVTGLLNDTVRGTIDQSEASLTVAGQAATIANRSYSATAIALQLGNNDLQLIATDKVGNISSRTLTINYVEPVGRRIELIGGDVQTGMTDTILPEMLTVRVLADDLTPVSGENVVFRVTQGSGVVINAADEASRALVTQTDAQGLANVRFKLGERVGSANQKVTVVVVDYETEVVFNASATGQLGNKISINAGNNQRGITGKTLPSPFIVSVSDAGANVVKGARVRFDVVAGGGTFADGQTSLQTLTDSDGRAFAEYLPGSAAGIDAQRVTAALLDADVAVLAAEFTATAFVPVEASMTSISGVVLDNQDKPLAGTTVKLTGTALKTTVDENGLFKLIDVPVGPVHLVADGATAQGGGQYPTLGFDIDTVAGVDNPLSQPIYMVRLTETNRAYAGPEDVVITMKDFPGFKLEIAKDSVTFADGSKQGWVSVTAVNANKVPMTPPNGSQPQFVITIQPSGARFDPPARITIPNVDGLAPGQQTQMYSFDHDLEDFVAIGLGSVSDDGAVITSNPGVGIVKAGWYTAPPPQRSGIVTGDNDNDSNSGGGSTNSNGSGNIGDTANGQVQGNPCKDRPFGCDPTQSGNDPTEVPDNAGQTGGEPDVCPVPPEWTGQFEQLDPVQNQNPHQAADPITMATGELEYSQTDMQIPGRGFDFKLQRTYRSRLYLNGLLGHSWVFNYHQFLSLPVAGAGHQNIIRSMPNGRQFTYFHNEDGRFNSPDSLFDVLVKQVDGSFTLRQPDGFKIHFDARGLMSRQQDRAGNTMTFLYDNEDRLATVIDTLGRKIVFSYRTDSGHIETVTDFFGRSVRYYYDDKADLVTARTPIVTDTPNGNDFSNGKFTFYTYSSGFDEVADPRLKHANHNLLTVTDAVGHTYLSHVYENDPDSYTFDKIISQQFGEQNQIFQLSYDALNQDATDTPPNLTTNKTTMIDRNGNKIEYFHNIGGMLLEERVYSNRDINPNDPAMFVTQNTYNQDGLRLTTTNPEGDSTTFQYDAANPLRYMQRNLLGKTYTPGSRGAAQEQLVGTYTYEPIYNQLKSTINRRGFTTGFTFDYQHGDNLAALAAELGQSEAAVTALLTNADITMTGGVSGQVAGNVVRTDSPDVTLPDGSIQKIFIERSYNRFAQMTEQVDAEGIVTQYQYYPETDPDGDGVVTDTQTALATDTGGYVKAVIKDAVLNAKRTRTGVPLAIKTETLYDAVGNPVKVIDGRGNSTRFIRNSLNQVMRKIAAEPFEYITDYYYDANNNLVRTSVQNVGVTGPSLSGFVHTIYRYNSLNDKTARIVIPASGVTLQTTYEYDANQNVTAVQKPEGNRIEQVYDERDLIYQVTRGAGSADASTRTLFYDGNGNLVRQIDAADNDGDGEPETTLTRYDGYNRAVETVDAAGNRMVYGYDANSNKVVEQYYGNSGIVGIENEVLLMDIKQSFDALDRLHQRDDGLLVNGIAQNVGFGQTPDDNLVSGVNWFDANGFVVKTVDDNGQTTQITYDGLNRRVLLTDQNGNTSVMAYDENNNLIQSTVTEKNLAQLVTDKVIVSSFVYDALNRKTSATDQLGNISQYRYDSRNNLIQTTDAQGNIVLYVYDGINRLLEQRQYLAVNGAGDGALDNSNPTNRDGTISTFYSYDGNSRLVSQSDDNGNATRYSYDSLDRKIETVYADGTVESGVFDLDDNLTGKTDQNGSLFSYSYDALHRLSQTTVAAAAGVVGSTLWTYQYDGLSRLVSASDNNDPALTTDDATTVYRYNSLNHLLSENNNNLPIKATYDGLGNQQTLVYGNGRQLSYQYDDIYNVTSINENQQALVTYNYAGRRVLQRQYANGNQLSYVNGSSDSGYDGINRAVQHRHSKISDGSLIAGFNYAYDKTHNRRFEINQFTQLADVYEYDSAYRLTRAAYQVPADHSQLQAIINNDTVNADVATIIAPQDTGYLLDGVGNWSSLQTIAANTSEAVGYQSNEMNEYQQIGPDAQTYDHNGNLISDSKRNYLYDAKNRLVRITTLGGNTVATYKYDAFNRRIEKKAGSETVRYVHFGKRVLEERDHFSQLQRQYVYGNGLDEVLQLRNTSSNASNDDFYYHDNSIGSVVALTDESGAVVERYSYNAYGETTIYAAAGNTVRASSAFANTYAYTGRRLDLESGLYYYRARYYAPETGRFIQRDPLGYADGMGVYSYTGNNPVNFVDPDGTDSRPVNDILILEKTLSKTANILSDFSYALEKTADRLGGKKAQQAETAALILSKIASSIGPGINGAAAVRDLGVYETYKFAVSLAGASSHPVAVAYAKADYAVSRTFLIGAWVYSGFKYGWGPATDAYWEAY